MRKSLYFIGLSIFISFFWALSFELFAEGPGRSVSLPRSLSKNPFAVLPQPVELKLLGLYPLAVGEGRFDASGLTLADGALFTVNDKLQVPFIFQISFPAAASKPDSPPSALKLRKFFKGTSRPPVRKSPHWKGFFLYLDLEGITHCRGQFFAISEQRKEVLRLDSKGKLSYHPIDFEKYQRSSAMGGRPVPPPSIWFNAGLEGIACDSEGRRLFVALERQPRMIFVLKMPERWEKGTVLHPIDHFDLPTYGLPRKVGKFSLEPNFSGLDFRRGKLYALYRSARLILVADPERHRLLHAYSYYSSVYGLYRRKKPYGLAEGLAVGERYIWIVLDNNGSARSSDSSDRRPVLLKFELPRGSGVR